MLPNLPSKALQVGQRDGPQPGIPSGSAGPSNEISHEPDQETLVTPVCASVRPSVCETEKTNTSGSNRQSIYRLFSKRWSRRDEENPTIIVHTTSTSKRREYIITVCRCMMLYGAPTYRLEEYLATTAKILEIDSQFLYIPGCVIISFDNIIAHTAEVQIVRAEQGINLSKLKDTHKIFKEVLQDDIGLDEAIGRLENVIESKNLHPRWLIVIMYGLASAFVSVLFKARWVDMPVVFFLGCFLGILQLILAPKSATYNIVFEISATILISCFARAFGSIRNGQVFCFSAIAQSSIAMILPGFLVLSAAVELKCRAIVPGSIRLVFAVIHSLFLGYGITVGTAIYGAIDNYAINESECRNPMNHYWSFLFVPAYVFCATFIAQAKYKQKPAMVIIALIGYIVNFFAVQKFTSSAPIAFTFGAFTIGILGNVYSRLFHEIAAAMILPAVYVQVPGGLAASGAINSALQTASALIERKNDTTDTTTENVNAIIFNVAGSMIHIAIGITVGLFMASLVVYPLGRRKRTL